MAQSKNMRELDETEVRSVVSDHYAKAVTAATQRGAGGCCTPQPVQIDRLADTPHEDVIGHMDKVALARAAGYTDDELAALPEDAVQASFGCGNPLNLAGLRAGDTVVDLGSGAGIDVLLAARLVGPAGHVIGVDMTDEMIAHAERNIREAGFTNAEIRKGLIEDLPVEAGTVDWVLSNCVINLSPNKPQVFREVFRVLKPGGSFLVSDIVVGDIPEVVREHVLGYVSCVGGAVAEDEYLRIIREAGFADAEVLLRHVYTQREMLGIAGYDRFPEGEAGDMARGLLDQLAGQIVSIKVRGTKRA